MQASSDRIAGCRIHRSPCTRRIHLSWRGECSSAFVEFILEDCRSSSRIRVDTTASWGNSQCKSNQLNVVAKAVFIFLINLQLAQVQSMAQGGGRTPQNHHQSFTDKLVEEALFPQGASPPPHLNNMHNPSGKLNGLSWFLFNTNWTIIFFIVKDILGQLSINCYVVLPLQLQWDANATAHATRMTCNIWNVTVPTVEWWDRTLTITT